MSVDPHRVAEARSLAAHRLIAQRLEEDPRILAEARQRVADWLRDAAVAAPYAERWHALLSGPQHELIATMTDPGEEATALRQCTPFAGAIDPRERWRLWEAVRQSLESQ